MIDFAYRFAANLLKVLAFTAVMAGFFAVLVIFIVLGKKLIGSPAGAFVGGAVIFVLILAFVMTVDERSRDD